MAQALTTKQLQALPKVELHCHLDGSVPLAVFQELARQGVPGVPRNAALLRAQTSAPRPCSNLAEYLSAFTLVLNVLTDMDVLWQATHALGAALAQENVLYAELRFAPLPLAGPKADADTVVRTVLDAMAAAQRQHGVVLRALLCMLRHMDEADNVEVLRLAYRHQPGGVAGVDLAGDEAGFPARLYTRLFARAAEMGLPFTIHAGECGNAQNVRDCVAMGARRIGHGVAAAHNPELCQLLARQGVLLENCPQSNLQTGAVAHWQAYPLVPFAQQGIPVCINTDNRTISATCLTDEYAALSAHFPGVDAAFLHARTIDALNGAFLPEADKAPLYAAVAAGFSEYLSPNLPPT